MDWMNILNQVFEVCIIPLLGVLTICLINYIKAKKQEILDKNNNALLEKYVNMLDNTITQCVLATTQTYVDNLKGQNVFDADAQKKAFEKTYQAVFAILADDAKEYLTNAMGDLETYVISKIEAEVKNNK